VNPVSRPGRAVAYAVAGWGVDACFTALNSLRRTGRAQRSSLWNAPVYALAQPLFEPLHDRLRGRPLAARALAYGGGILAVEYAAGRVFRRTRGRAPWDYSYARHHVDGLVRPDFFPLWVLFGLALERLHDVLCAAEPDSLRLRSQRR